MKLLFSEAGPDYSKYLYPYAIWALPEQGETPADLFHAGFMPARSLERFYLCRHIRVGLSEWKPTSENRRILRKGAGISLQLMTRAEFSFDSVRRDFALEYAKVRFGPTIMPAARIEGIIDSGVVTHILVFNEINSGRELGFVFLFLQKPELAHYMYGFYDLDYLSRNLGMFMMTASVQFFAAEKFGHIYLGTCYSQRALYKWQFDGCEFFNGNRWSADLSELKYLLSRQEGKQDKHLLEDAVYMEKFGGDNLEAMAHWQADFLRV